MLNSKHGFTLVEVMATVIIIGILVAIATPMVRQYMVSTYRTCCLTTQDKLRQSVAAYKTGTLQNYYSTFECTDDGTSEYRGQTYHKVGTINKAVICDASDWDCGSYNAATKEWTGGSKAACLYVYNGGTKADGSTQLYYIVCQSAGERFIRYAYGYKGKMDDFEIFTHDDCCILISDVGIVSCTDPNHVSNDIY